jgi:VWFA-related protein
MMRLALTALAACAVALAVAGLRAQQTPVFRANVELVRVDVLVTDGGRPIAGLTAADFELKDNDVIQEVQLVADVRTVNVVVVLDMSGSVRGEQIEHLKEATRSLLRALRPGDTASLVTFAQRIVRHADAEHDPTVVERALEAITPGSRTALYDALYAGLALAVRDTGRSLVLLFTDGVENSSWLSHDALFESLRHSAAIVEVVASGQSPPIAGRPAAADRLLRNIADEAGGEMLSAG